MPELTVSFVVLSYNFAAYLGECVDSILRQDGDHDFEIIVVDDASTDATAALLDSFCDSRITVLRHAENQGHAATVNDGIARARGRFIARIDGDDRYRPGFLNAVLPVFSHHPEVGLVYGDAALMDRTGKITVDTSDRVHGADHKGKELVALLELNFICAPTVIARREAWEPCLPVPSHLAFHDWYFTILMARRYEFYYLHRVLADYRVHPGNHHSRITLDRSEEPSIFYILDTVYSEVETPLELEQTKRRARGIIYGRHYLVLADKYFGVGYNSDARRCYLAAIRNHPAHLLNGGVQRRLAATIFGRERYEAGKAFLKNVLSRG